MKWRNKNQIGRKNAIKEKKTSHSFYCARNSESIFIRDYLLYFIFALLAEYLFGNV